MIVMGSPELTDRDLEKEGQLTMFALPDMTPGPAWRYCHGCHRMVDEHDANHWAACITLNSNDPS